MAKRTRREQYPIAPVLTDITGTDVPDLTDADGWKKILCPFGHENHPSARLSRHGFYCYSCGRQGDAISLLQRECGLDHQAAKRRAQALAGGTSPGVPRTGWGSSRIPRSAWH